jgi:uroporphyrinogen-III decarboxylase
MRGSLYDIDLNAYCSGHITGLWTNEKIIAFPRNFVTEAQALGAAIHQTANGFETVQYLFNDPEDFCTMPFLADTEPVYRVLEQIRQAAPQRKTILLKVNGPYSILASLVEPKLFYRWFVKNNAALHDALDTVSEGLAEYICGAVLEGVKIISLADPYANLQILGEKRYREFAAPYLLKLLQNISARINGARGEKKIILHICPHNSVPLAQLGYTETEDVPVSGASYIDVLTTESTFQPGLTLLGNQCIYSENTGKITRLILL